jgi:hypothetical protein
MFKRYSKNGGETSTFCLVAVLAREAERLSSLRLEYDLDPKLEEGRTTSFPFSDRYHLVSLHFPARQDSPPSVGFEVSEVVTTVMRAFFRFLPSSAVFRELREQVSRPSHSLFGITGIAGITDISRREQVSPDYLGLRYHPLMLTREPGRTLLSEMATRRTTAGLSFWSGLRHCCVGNRRIILFSSPAVKERNAGQNHQHSEG